MSDTLTTPRHAKFMENVASCYALDPGRLPPSERAAHFHALRVHLQVSQWKYLDLKCLKPEEWGWVFHGNTLIPVKTDLQPAPPNLLKYIHCKCKISSKNTCGTQACSCRKNGLSCILACGDCRGKVCQNRLVVADVDVIDEDDVNSDLLDHKSMIINNATI